MAAKSFDKLGLSSEQMKRFLSCEKMLFQALKDLNGEIEIRAFKLRQMMKEVVADGKRRKEIDKFEETIDNYLKEIEDE